MTEHKFLGAPMTPVPPTNIWLLECRTFHAMRLGEDSWVVTTVNGQQEFDKQEKAEEYAMFEINHDVELIMKADDKLDGVDEAMRALGRMDFGHA